MVLGDVCHQHWSRKVCYLDQSSYPLLCLEISRLYLRPILRLSSFWRRPFSVCETLLILWSDFKVRLWVNHSCLKGFWPIPLEVACFTETATVQPLVHSFGRGYSLATAKKPLGWLPQKQAAPLEVVGGSLQVVWIEVFELFGNYSFTLEINLWEMGSQLSKYLRTPPLLGLWLILCWKTMVLTQAHL